MQARLLLHLIRQATKWRVHYLDERPLQRESYFDEGNRTKHIALVNMLMTHSRTVRRLIGVVYKVAAT